MSFRTPSRAHRNHLLSRVSYAEVATWDQMSTQDQRKGAVKLCAVALQIDPDQAAKVDPETMLPILWNVLQWRSLSPNERYKLNVDIEKIRSVVPEIADRLRTAETNIAVNPEWEPWSLSDEELQRDSKELKTELWVSKTFFGITPLSLSLFVKTLRETVKKGGAKAFMGEAAKTMTLPTIVFGAMLAAMAEAVDRDQIETQRRKERVAAGQALRSSGVEPNPLVLGPAPVAAPR